MYTYYTTENKIKNEYLKFRLLAESCSANLISSHFCPSSFQFLYVQAPCFSKVTSLWWFFQFKGDDDYGLRELWVPVSGTSADSSGLTFIHTLHSVTDSHSDTHVALQGFVPVWEPKTPPQVSALCLWRINIKNWCLLSTIKGSATFSLSQERKMQETFCKKQANFLGYIGTIHERIFF